MTSDLHHLAGAYALDALDDDERAAFEAHYPTCDVCSADVDSFRAAAASLAQTVKAEPPPRLRDSIMAEIATTEQLSPELDNSENPAAFTAVSNRPAPKAAGRFQGRTVVAAAAAVMLLVVGGLALAGRDSQLPVNELAASADAVPSMLAATTATQTGEIEIVWSAERDKVAVIATDLPDPGEGQTYALWFFLEDEVAPAALFQPEDGTVEVVLDVDDLDADGWGITIEPAGGSDAPTGDVIFTATI